jgi:hypothetical protein
MASSRISGPLGFADPLGLGEVDPAQARWPYGQRYVNQLQPHTLDPFGVHTEPGSSLAARGQFAFLFTIGCSPKLGVGEDDFRAAAAELGVEAEAIQAVSQVETKRHAFDERGRPTILFERHYFCRLTYGRFTASHPIISQPTATPTGGYGSFSGQYSKLQEAYNLDRDAALCSASWGRFQIMGANFRSSGFSNVSNFVNAMTQSELAHLTAFVSHVQSSTSLLAALRKKDWATFARHYNGPKYQDSNYDGRMQSAYVQRVKAMAGNAVKSL